MHIRGVRAINPQIYLCIGIAAAALIAGIGAGTYLQTNRSGSKARKVVSSAEAKAEEIMKTAEKDSKVIYQNAEVEAKEHFIEQMKELERETRKRQIEYEKTENRLARKEEALEKKDKFLDKRERTYTHKTKELSNRQKSIDKLETRRKDLIKEQETELARVSGLTQQEARELIIGRLEDEARKDAASGIRKIIDDARDQADMKAKEIIATAIQRISSDFVSETTVSVVSLPNDEMKGRIIGREGRNIRALEAATGVDLIIDDTPEAVIISAFDPIRREIAATALNRLISDGRIHPARIEEIVDKVQKEIDKSIREAGEQLAFEVGVQGLKPELVRLLGRLKYRTSYGQNVLQHSKEVAFIAGMMASELGVNTKLAKRAGLLHDIGKAVDHEIEGSHALIGAEIAQKFNEPREVVRAMAAHHGDEPPTTIEAILIQAADALSAARPGARREILESYLKRLAKLEEISTSFRGVEKSYAVQAGREIRIIVTPEDISDDEMALMARDVAKRIEQELEYPGEIKVTAIRESRAVEYAR
ncbi:ribonuclease Y [bacterium]|nr:ribonuclease Y [candidate division CSSED10-310 bacterium]